MSSLSIIIPALDEEEQITATLTPLQELRARGIEVLLVDGGSQDRTRELAAPLADRVLDAPRGRAWQMNEGARAARGDVLLFLHADTSLPKDAERLVTEALARTGRVWGRFDLRLSGRNPQLRMVETLINIRTRLSSIATGDQAIFVERRAFEALGGYEEIPLMEDIALTRALKRRSRPAHIAARVTTSSRRWEEHGIWRTIFWMWKLRWAYARGADPHDLVRGYHEKAEER